MRKRTIFCGKRSKEGNFAPLKGWQEAKTLSLHSSVDLWLQLRGMKFPSFPSQTKRDDSLLNNFFLADMIIVIFSSLISSHGSQKLEKRYDISPPPSYFIHALRGSVVASETGEIASSEAGTAGDTERRGEGKMISSSSSASSSPRDINLRSHQAEH